MKPNNFKLSAKEKDYLLKFCTYDLKDNYPINSSLNPTFYFLNDPNHHHLEIDPKLDSISKNYFNQNYLIGKYHSEEMNYIYNIIRNYFLTKQLSNINDDIQNNNFDALNYNNLKGFICSKENKANYIQNFNYMPNEILATIETNYHILENLDKSFYNHFKTLAPQLKKEANELKINLLQSEDKVLFEKPTVINEFPKFHQPYFHYEFDAYMHQGNLFFWLDLYNNEVQANDGDFSQQTNLKNFFDYAVYQQFHQSNPEEIDNFFETKDKNKIEQLKQILHEQENRQIITNNHKQKHL